MAAPFQPTSATASRPTAQDEHRRGFFARAAAVAVGGIVAVFPFAAGLAVFSDPLRRKSQRDALVRVASLDAVPEDGTPRKFPVIADRHDAWNSFPKEPIGAVFLRRVTPSDKVDSATSDSDKSKSVASATRTIEALNVICPHLGCFVGFSEARKEYLCPCHASAFAIDGAFISGPSPRGLDTLECEIREQDGRQEVWVKFQDFYCGMSDKRAKT